jgi:cystathionine beta-lyase/cystathionine gamma-synthase
MKRKTEIMHTASRDAGTGALSIPIYNASTFHQANVEKPQEWEYGRGGNPTRGALEELLARLENGAAGFAFSSGMAAMTAAIMAFVKAGDHIVATRDIYGGSYRLLTGFLPKFGITHTFVDMTDPRNVERAIGKSTTLILLETPSNPLLRVTDIEAVAAIAKKHGILTLLDNTFMTPYLQRPLDLGIDVSVHSATKFLGGHSDLIAGAVIVKAPERAGAVKFTQNTCGAVLGPQDSWLLIRGIKTLSARMDTQGANAMRVAKWLADQPWIDQVYYPGLATHPGHEILKRQATGFGAVVSIKTDTVERALTLMKRVKIWNVAVSLGGVESILSYPRLMSHAAIPAVERETLGITDTVLRLSIGLEDAEDLIEDLEQAARAGQ